MLISNDKGDAVAYAMWNLEDRGPMMIEPGWKVYQGMIVGQHTRDNDLEVNVMKGKKLTNIRTHSKDEAVRLTPPIQMTLEKALAYIQDDELVEVTPKSIRLRKALLDPNDRKRAERAKGAAAAEGVRTARPAEPPRGRHFRAPLPDLRRLRENLPLCGGARRTDASPSLRRITYYTYFLLLYCRFALALGSTFVFRQPFVRVRHCANAPSGALREQSACVSPAPVEIPCPRSTLPVSRSRMG